MLQYSCIRKVERGVVMDNTKVYDSNNFQNEYISDVIKEVAEIL